MLGKSRLLLLCLRPPALHPVMHGTICGAKDQTLTVVLISSSNILNIRGTLYSTLHSEVEDKCQTVSQLSIG